MIRDSLASLAPLFLAAYLQFQAEKAVPGTVGIDFESPLALEMAVLTSHSADWAVTIGIGVFICERDIDLSECPKREIFELLSLSPPNIDPFDSVVLFHGMDSTTDPDVDGILFEPPKDREFDPMVLP